jgi:hypothetical protein
LNLLARQIVEESIGEHLDGSPLIRGTLEITERDKEAQESGRIGGLKGGNLRAAVLTPAQRSKIARKAALTRWRPKPKDNQ